MLQVAPMSTSACTSKSTTTFPTTSNSSCRSAVQMMIATSRPTATSSVAVSGNNNRDEPDNSASSSPPKTDDSDKIQRVADFLQEALALADDLDFKDEPTPMQQQVKEHQKEDERSTTPTACTTISVCTKTTATSPCSSLAVSLEDDDQQVSDDKSMKTPVRSRSCDLSPTTTRTAPKNRSLRRSITALLETKTSTDTDTTTRARRNRSKSSPSLNTSSLVKKTCPVKMPARRTNSADNLRELMARDAPDHSGVSRLKRQSPCNSVTKLCRQTTDTTSSSSSEDKSARMPKRSASSQEQLEQTTTTTTLQVVVDTSLVAQHHANSRKDDDDDDASSLSSDDEDDVSSSSCSTIGSEELSELIDLSNWKNHQHHLLSSSQTRSSSASSAGQPPTRLSQHTMSSASFSYPQQQQQYPYGCCAGTVCTYTTNGTGPRPWICLCQEENDCDFVFCGMCGAARNWTCTHCHFARNKNRASFCGGCGVQR